MTESKIFEILLHKEYDFPKLNEEAAATIANSFTDIIYDTLKLKSTLPTIKRLNILKLLRTIAGSSNDHVSVNEKNYVTFIESCDQQLETNDLKDFLNGVRTELQENCPAHLSAQVQSFYKMKNGKHQKNIKKMEMIKKYDQADLDKAEFPSRITRTISYYETSESIIKKLLTDDSVISNHKTDSTDLNYREKQIKFAYGLLHLQQWPSLNKVLEKLIKYKPLTKYEVNFLLYLSQHIDSENFELRPFLMNNYIFIYEQMIIELATEIIQLESIQMSTFLETLLFEKKFVILKKAMEDGRFYLKLKNLLYELYVYSFCHNNLLQFINFVV